MRSASRSLISDDSWSGHLLKTHVVDTAGAQVNNPKENPHRQAARFSFYDDTELYPMFEVI